MDCMKAAVVVAGAVEEEEEGAQWGRWDYLSSVQYFYSRVSYY